MADVYFMVGSDFLSSQMGADNSGCAPVTMPQKIPAHKYENHAPIAIRIKNNLIYLILYAYTAIARNMKRIVMS